MHQAEGGFARHQDQFSFFFQHHVGGAEQDILAVTVRDASERAHGAGNDHHRVGRIRAAGERGVHALEIVGLRARGQAQAIRQFQGHDLLGVMA